MNLAFNSHYVLDFVLVGSRTNTHVLLFFNIFHMDHPECSFGDLDTIIGVKVCLKEFPSFQNRRTQVFNVNLCVVEMVNLSLEGRSTEVTKPQLMELSESVQSPEAQKHSKNGLPRPETLHKQNGERNITISTRSPS